LPWVTATNESNLPKNTCSQTAAPAEITKGA